MSNARSPRSPFSRMDDDSVMSLGGPIVVPDISRPAPSDDEVEALLATAIKDEDFETVDLCETVLKMVVAPNIRRNAQAKIAEILALKESTHAPH